MGTLALSVGEYVCFVNEGSTQRFHHIFKVVTSPVMVRYTELSDLQHVPM